MYCYVLFLYLGIIFAKKSDCAKNIETGRDIFDGSCGTLRAPTWNIWTGYAGKRNSKTSDNKLQTHRNNPWTDQIYNQNNKILDISTKLKTYIETTFINEISLCIRLLQEYPVLLKKYILHDMERLKMCRSFLLSGPNWGKRHVCCFWKMVSIHLIQQKTTFILD